MWVVTIFNNINDIRIFEFSDKASAKAKLIGLRNAVLSYTN